MCTPQNVQNSESPVGSPPLPHMRAEGSRPAHIVRPTPSWVYPFRWVGSTAILLTVFLLGVHSGTSGQYAQTISALGLTERAQTEDGERETGFLLSIDASADINVADFPRNLARGTRAIRNDLERIETTLMFLEGSSEKCTQIADILNRVYENRED